MQFKVLIIEDNPDDREMIRRHLAKVEEAEYRCFEASGGEEGIAMVTRHRPDCVLLDYSLPGQDGLAVLKSIHDITALLPVIMLTGQGSDADTILGLDAGANDYVTKPFKFPVLVARIRAQLRQHEQSEDAVFQLGPYTFKPAQKMLITEEEKKIRLTEKETNILKFLYRATEGVVARDVLLHEVWGYNAGVTTHTLETHIYRLRQKIEPDPSNARLLVTESGGYRLVA
jgi:DNA-binding response OmpR family regulator